MDFGIFVDFDVRQGNSQAETFDESFRQIESAEELGIRSVWLAEVHFSPNSVLSSPMIVASAVATRTKTIRLGLAVQVLPLANPLRVAEEAATVDHISQGRFEFGIGRSGLTRYYQGYNVDYSESEARFYESLEVIKRAWCESPFSHAGEYYHFENVDVVPRPYQKPHPPFRIAVASEDTFSKIGRMGHPIFVSTITPMPELLERLRLYREARRQAGHTGPDDVVLRIPAYVAEIAANAYAEPEGSTMYMTAYSARQIGSAPTEEIAGRLERMRTVTYDELLREKVVYGTPEAVVERLQEYKETLGISGVVLEMNYGGQIPFDRVLNSIRLLVDRVIPNFE